MGGNSTLTIQGKVEICVTGDMKLAGDVFSGGTTSPKHPGDFRIRVANTGSDITLSGHTSLYADLYAPLRNVTLNGLPQGFYGSMIADQIVAHGTPDIHLDTSIVTGLSTPTSVFLVR